MKLCEESDAAMPQSLIDLLTENVNLTLSEESSSAKQQGIIMLIRRVASLLEKGHEWHRASAILAVAGLRVEALDCLAAGGDPSAIVTFASKLQMISLADTRSVHG